MGIPCGLLGGYGISAMIFQYINKTYEALEMDGKVAIYFSPLSVLGIIGATLGVVLVSAYFPARKVSKLSPIEAIKQGDYKVKKLKPSIFAKWIGRMLGYEGILALKFNNAHQEGFRAAYISLTLSFVILMGGVIYFNVWETSINYDPRPIEYEMKLYLGDVSQEEFERLDKEVRALKEVEKVLRSKGTIYGNVEVRQEDLSDKLRQKGVEYLEEEVPLIEGKYDFTTEILTIDDASFKAYCEQIGTNAEEFFENEGMKAILYNQVTYNDREIREKQESVPLFNWIKGDKITVTEDLSRMEKAQDAYTFEVEIGYVTD